MEKIEMKENTEMFKNLPYRIFPPELGCFLKVATWQMDLMAYSGAVGQWGAQRL